MKKYKKGDIVVVHKEKFGDRQYIGEIYEATDDSQYSGYVYGSKYGDCQHKDCLRLATPSEINAYNTGIRNIKDIPVNLVQNLEIW